ncbi:MAG: energy transducer TonB [Steroidobacteraceae bacterium]
MAYEYSIDDPARNQKRTLAFAIVVVIHVLFFWVLASGLGAKIVEVVIPPVQTKIIEDKPEDKPPPPPPEMEQPPPYVPPPELSIDVPTETATTAITNTTSERPTAAPVAPPPKPVEHQVVKTLPSVTGKGARTTQPEYPPSSRRAGEAGTVTLAAYVLESGKVGEVKVVKSSGYEKLDEAAVKEVQRNWRFVPGKEDGKPVAMWHTFNVVFKLTD